jgi:hypothetical protein
MARQERTKGWMWPVVRFRGLARKLIFAVSAWLTNSRFGRTGAISAAGQLPPLSWGSS